MWQLLGETARSISRSTVKRVMLKPETRMERNGCHLRRNAGQLFSLHAQRTAKVSKLQSICRMPHPPLLHTIEERDDGHEQQ